MKYVAAILGAVLLCAISFIVLVPVFASFLPPSVEEFIQIGPLETSSVLAGIVGLLIGACSYRATLKHYEKKAPPAAESGNTTDEPPAAPAKTKPKQYSCCLVTVILLVIGGVVFFGYLFRERQKVVPRCEKYLDAVERGDYKAAYRLISGRWRAAQTYDEYVKLEKTFRKALGKHRARTVVRFEVRADTGGTVGLVVFDAEFENGECEIIFTMAKEDDNWRVQAVRYNSPALLQLFECPHCGTTQKEVAKFCSDCGKTMKPEAAQPTTKPKAVAPAP